MHHLHQRAARALPLLPESAPSVWPLGAWAAEDYVVIVMATILLEYVLFDAEMACTGASSVHDLTIHCNVQPSRGLTKAPTGDACAIFLTSMTHGALF